MLLASLAVACFASLQVPFEVPPPGEILAEIQAARNARELGELAPSPLLDEAARTHADDMANRGYFEFSSPDGDDVETWAREAGYDVGWITEKLGRTNGPVLELIRSWLEVGTESALFSEQAAEIGIATATADHETYVVIVLAADADELLFQRAAGLQDLERAREELLAEINDHRSREGRGELHRNRALEAAAQAHARELLASGSVAPTTGRRPPDVVDRAGAHGYGVRQIVAVLLDGPTDVGEATERWMSSGAHRRTLLRPVYRDAGLGVAVGRDGVGRVTVMWVLYLARPRA